NYERWRTEFKTWGKWGTDDNKGTSNLITPDKIIKTMKLVKEGIVVSLAHPEPQQAAADVNANGVFKRTTNAITNGGTTDNYQVSYHGQTVAHIDTWCHFFVDGQMYNGTPVKDNITPETGCKKGSVMNWMMPIQLSTAIWMGLGIPSQPGLGFQSMLKSCPIKAGRRSCIQGIVSAGNQGSTGASLNS